MCPAKKVKKFEFWRARLGGTLILEFSIFVRFSLFLISTHSENAIYVALTLKFFKFWKTRLMRIPINLAAQNSVAH